MNEWQERRVCVVDRKAVRATLILIPLLGLQYMLFPMRPQEGSLLDDVYLITVAIVTSLQVAYDKTRLVIICILLTYLRTYFCVLALKLICLHQNCFEILEKEKK